MMQLHVNTSITSNTGKCQDVITASIQFVEECQAKYLAPIGMMTTSKSTSHSLRDWFSHRNVSDDLGKAILRNTCISRKTPTELLEVFKYMTDLNRYNSTTTGDCNIRVSWTVG